MPKTSKLYPKAPIVEAVIDIKTRFKSPLSRDSLESFASRLHADFPRKEDINIITVDVTHHKEGQVDVDVEPDSGFVGLKLHKADNSRILQIKNNGLTLSHLAPYSSWETFSSEAKALWNEFSRHTGSTEVFRLATRFINKIDVPHSMFDLQDYFHIYPHLPEEKGREAHLAHFVMQLKCPQPDIDCMAQVAQASINSGDPNSVSFLLDIDIFHESSLKADSEEIWTKLDVIRDRKNELFESYISDLTRELIS